MIVDEAHSYLVRQWHEEETQPEPPALDIKYKRTEPARVVDPSTNLKITTHFYDPNLAVSPPSPPAPYPGSLREEHERCVRFRHTGAAPAAPDLGLPLAAALTGLISAGFFYTLYRYQPDAEPGVIGEPIEFGDGELFTFGDSEVFAFGD